MSGPLPAPAGYVHEAVYFADTPQLVAVAAPLLLDALNRGDDVALVCSDAANRALGEALGDRAEVSVLPRLEIYQKAVTAVAYFRDFVEERLNAGARRVCIIGQVDFSTSGRALDEWRRYEALLNHAMSPFPLWSLCAYDTGRLPDAVLATGELTHPYLRRDGAQVPNAAYVDPAELMRLADADSTLVPQLEPDLTIPEVLDLGELHQELMAILFDENIDTGKAEDVTLAVHELVTNGVRHGEPPITVRVWISPGRLACTVSDKGPGFDDPFLGYVRGAGDPLPEGRFGLRLARQLCDDLVTARTPEGFTARLIVHY